VAVMTATLLEGLINIYI